MSSLFLELQNYKIILIKAKEILFYFAIRYIELHKWSLRKESKGLPSIEKLTFGC